MNICIRPSVTAALIMLSTFADAALVPLTGGYELEARQVSLPQHTYGNVVIRICQDCESIVHGVDQDTRYVIADEGAVTLKDFLAEVRRGKMQYMLLGYYIDTDIVEQVTLLP